MNQPAFITLLQNAAWLLVLVVVFDLATSRQRLAGRPLRQFFTGIVLGGLCMALIMTSFRLESGIIFDTRSVLLSISGLFFGPLPTAVAMFITAAFRLLKGGIGAWTGVSVTFATGILGIVWGRLRRGRLQDIRARELYVLGILAHVVMLVLMLTLPWDRAKHVLHDISLPVLLIYPVAATALGLLLANRLRREQAAVDLAASEERLRLALEAARMGTFDFDLRSHRIVWSRKHEELWGFKPGEFDGTLAAFAARVHPDDLPGILAEMERCQNAQMPFAREFRVVWPDAGVHWIAAMGQYGYDTGGRPLCFRGAAMEVTTLKQVETLRHENEERFRDMIMRSPVPTGLVEADGTISLVNDRFRQLFGYAAADVPTIAAWWRRAYPDEHYRQEVMSAWNAAMEQAARNHTVAKPQEFAVTCKDGSRRVAEVAGLPLRGGVMATFIDVTARHQAEMQQQHLTAVLRAIRNVNQLIVREKDPDALLRQACDLLTESRGYRSAWVCRRTAEGRLQVAGESGVGADFQNLREQLAQGEWPRCCRQAFATPGIVVAHDTAEACRGCALAGSYADQSALAAAVRHGDQIFGAIVVALPRAMASDPEEQGLFVEVADDIGFALHSIETEQKRRQAEQDLLFQKMILEETGRIAKVGGWSFDALTGAGFWSDEVARIHDMAPGEATTREIGINFYTPGSREKIQAAVNAAIADGTPYDLELELVSAKGVRKWVRTIGHPVKENGRVVRVQGSFQDVTDPRLAFEALQASERQFRTFVENAPDAIFIQTKSRFAYVNPAAVKLFGASNEKQLLGTPVAERFRSEYRPVVAERIRRLNVDRQPVSQAIHRVLRCDGTEVDAEFSGVPIEYRGENGALVFVRDVSERLKAEEALRESETRFRTLVDGAPEGIFVQAEGRFLFLNPAMCRLLGFAKPEDLVGTDLMARITPEFHEAVRERIRRQNETGEIAPPMGQEYLRRDGTRVPVETTAIPVRFGNRDAHLVFVRDVSERKRTEEERQKLQSQLAQAQKMDSVGRLAGGVAHDFNNMLGVILGHAEMALETVAPGQPLYNGLEEIRKAAERSADLTRQLLAFARKQTVAPKMLDLNETVEGTLKMLRRLIGEHIELAWHPGKTPARVLVDPSQIDQVLANLCVNARDAIGDVGKVTIETGLAAFDAAHCAAHPGDLPGDFALLAVSDNGCGMSPEILLHLFEPFYTTKEIGKGTGLGLATVYGIVKQNNGFISVYSEPGHGSTFKIYLPRHAAPAVARSPVPAPLPLAGHETILLVEDEPLLLLMTQTLLEQAGYNVLVAPQPSAALQLAEQHAGKIDLLITDVVMPGMNGRELAQKLLTRQPDLRRLFMSGYTANVIAHHGVLDPCVHFISKPFSLIELAAKIREALGGPGSPSPA